MRNRSSSSSIRFACPITNDFVSPIEKSHQSKTCSRINSTWKGMRQGSSLRPQRGALSHSLSPHSTAKVFAPPCKSLANSEHADCSMRIMQPSTGSELATARTSTSYLNNSKAVPAEGRSIHSCYSKDLCTTIQSLANSGQVDCSMEYAAVNRFCIAKHLHQLSQQRCLHHSMLTGSMRIMQSVNRF